MAGFWNETVTSPTVRATFVAFIQDAITQFGVVSVDDVFLASLEGYLDNGATYQATLTDFFGFTRAAIGNHRIALDQTSINPGVEAAIVAFAAVDGGLTKIVHSDDLPIIGGGNIHYPMDSYDTWGQRCAAQILSFP